MNPPSPRRLVPVSALGERAGEVVGIDLVEVAPDYDLTGSTAFLAAQLLLNFLGYIYHAKGKSA